MAKKGLPGVIAATTKRLFGTHEGAYSFVKKTGYFFISLLRSLRLVTPHDLAYRIFPPEKNSEAGYVTKVTKLGISGLAFPADDGTPAKVDLLIDGTRINRTWATQKVHTPSKYGGTMIGFYFPMKQVWKHVEKKWELKVLANGRALRYQAGPGKGAAIPNRGVVKLRETRIIDLVNDGYLITKFGRIQAPREKNKEWSGKIFGNYEEVNKSFEECTGKSLFAFYGVMLGYAREGGILAHDMDLDLAYFSEESEPEAVRKEFRRITEKLIHAGLTIEAHTYKLLFGGKGLSVTPCWIASGGFASTFGYVGDGYTVKRSDILPLQKARHMEYELLLPANPSAVAAYIYGRGWKYPDPGWKWLPEYKNRPEILAARLTEKDVRELRDLAENRNNNRTGA